MARTKPKKLNRPSHRAVLSAIAQQPGRWALLARLEKLGSAAALASKVRNGYFAPGFEAVAWNSDVYARLAQAPAPEKTAHDVLVRVEAGESPVAVTWLEPPGRPSASRDQLVREQRRYQLEAIRQEPGRWALFATLGTAGSANNFAIRVRRGYFGKGFEATARGCDVYVRYAGDACEPSPRQAVDGLAVSGVAPRSREHRLSRPRSHPDIPAIARTTRR
jgi:hypothetical protein